MFPASLFLRRWTALNTVPIRTRRRDHAQRQLARRLANRQKRNEEKETPKLSKFEEILARRSSVSASISQQHPARSLTTMDLPAKPDREDISWIAGDYLPPVSTVEAALTYLLGVNHPDILNRPDAFVQVRLDLNMTTEKASKFLTDMSKVVVFPHPYPHTEKRLILAFAKDVNHQTQAAEAGAEIVGGPELVKKILKGVLRVDDVDYVACHVDMLQDVTPLRGLLKHHYPSLKAGNVSLDVAALVRYFQFGVKALVKADKRYPEYGVCMCNVGKLNWPNEHLENNVNSFINEISALRPPTAKRGQFIDRAVMMVPPEPDYCVIDHLLYAPPIPAEDAVDDKKSKKGKKKAKLVTPEPIPEESPVVTEEESSVSALSKS